MPDNQFVKQFEQQWRQSVQHHQESLDCQQLLDGIQKRKNKHIVEVIAGILIGLIVPIFIGWQMYKGLPAMIDYIAMSFVMLLSLAVTFGGYFMRKGSSAQLGLINVEYIQLILGQIKHNMRLLKMGMMFCAVTIVLFSSLFIAMMGMSLVTGTPLSRPELAGAIMALIILCFPTLYWYQKRIYQRLDMQKQRLELVLTLLE